MKQNLAFDCLLHEEPERALEVTVKGSHIEGSANEIGRFLSSAVEEHNAQHLIVNLLKFDYTFGNDISGALIRASVSLERHGGVLPCRLVAGGRTARSLESLFKGARLDMFISPRIFENVDAALDDAKGL